MKLQAASIEEAESAGKELRAQINETPDDPKKANQSIREFLQKKYDHDLDTIYSNLPPSERYKMLIGLHKVVYPQLTRVDGQVNHVVRKINVATPRPPLPLDSGESDYEDAAFNEEDQGDQYPTT